jgi:biotin carboxyl carrier protein
MEQQWKTDFGTAPTVERTLRTTVLASGALRPRADGEAHIAAPVAGRLLGAGAAFPRVGMEVKKEQLLAVPAPRLSADVDPATLELAVSQAKLRVDYARRHRERVEALLTQQAVPERRALEARQGEALAHGELSAASKRLAQLQATQRVSGAGASGRVELRAPVAGVVASVGAAPGAFVDDGRELFHVVDLDRLWLEVQIPEADIGRVGRPTGASFEVEGFDRPREVSASNAGASWRSAASSTRRRAPHPLSSRCPTLDALSRRACSRGCTWRPDPSRTGSSTCSPARAPTSRSRCSAMTSWSYVASPSRFAA